VTWAQDFIRAEATKLRERAAEAETRADAADADATRLHQQAAQLIQRATELEALAGS